MEWLTTKTEIKLENKIKKEASQIDHSVKKLFYL
jgi:hypothetical protein